jgi:hypothetical protein
MEMDKNGSRESFWEPLKYFRKEICCCHLEWKRERERNRERQRERERERMQMAWGVAMTGPAVGFAMRTENKEAGNTNDSCLNSI